MQTKPQRSNSWQLTRKRLMLSAETLAASSAEFGAPEDEQVRAPDNFYSGLPVCRTRLEFLRLACKQGAVYDRMRRMTTFFFNLRVHASAEHKLRKLGQSQSDFA